MLSVRIAKCDAWEDGANHRNFHSTWEWIAATLPDRQIWRIDVRDDTLYFVVVRLKKVRIFSTSFLLEPEIIDAICGAIFRRFLLAAIIEFQWLLGYRDDARLSYPYRTKERKSHYVLKLPATWELYTNALEPERAKKFAYYRRHFFRDFPGASVRIVETGQTSDVDVQKIYAAAISRRESKGLSSRYNQSTVSAVARLSKLAGLRFVLSVGEEVCAQSLLIKQSNIAYLLSLAQQARYDKYSPGVLCLYLGIEQLISRGFCELDLSSPYMKYKTDLGAAAEDRCTIEVMRNDFYLALRQWFKRDGLRAAT